MLPLLAILLIRRHRQHAALRTQLHASGLRISQLQAQAAGLNGAAAAAGAAAGAGPGGAASAQPAPLTISRQRTGWFSRRSALLGVLVVAVAGGAVAGGILLLRADRVAAAKPPAHRPPARAELPTIPVAVLNASQTTGAAKALARQLQADRVKVAAIGNVSESLPGALTILYAPGARAQAAQLARLVSARSPAVAPINPVTQAAAGPKIKLVVVIE